MKAIDPVQHLIQVDPILAIVIKKVSRPEWEKVDDYFLKLVREIINQQLSDRASAVLTERFFKLFPQAVVTPELILKMDKEKMRSSGISYAKVAYIKDLADKMQKKLLHFDKIHVMNDEEAIVHLSQVKGIGRWTAEMFLMFSLGRPDIFSYGDQGLKNAIKKLYKLKSHPTPKQAEKITSKWKPYRSWGCRYLWASLDLV